MSSTPATTDPLLLRPPTADDEDQARQAQTELEGDGFWFLLGLRRGEPWNRYLDRLEAGRQAGDGDGGAGPATFLVAEVAGRLVGRVSIRHDAAADHLGGHIGYGVRPAFRRRGYATEMLRQSVAIARTLGVERVVVICHDDNPGSARVIEACGGVLTDVLPAQNGSAARRRYLFEPAGPAGRATGSACARTAR